MSLGHSGGGRLPPLHAIGRSKRIDLDDDPPDLDDDDLENFIDNYDFDARRTFHSPPYIYETSHADATAEALGGIFKTLEPGGHVCKRSAGQPSINFTHCKASVNFGAKFSHLRHLLETKARLQLIRDLITRVNALAFYVKDLERVVQEDMQTWHDICHGLLEAPPATHLESLSALLEELRLHMNHWNSLKQLLHTDRWLRHQRPKLITQLDKVQGTLSQLRNQAIWWVDRLIHVGLRVLAHCDLERLSQDSLWSITRGLEDFNTLTVAVKMENGPLFRAGNTHSTATYIPTPYLTNHFKNIIETLKPIPFARVLNVLANERAQYAAAITQDFFTGNQDFLRVVSQRQLPEYSWSDNCQGSGSRSSMSRSQSGVNTSDYHSASGSHVSLSTAMLRVGSVTAPDLSKEPSPLFDFSRREQTFANRFLQIVCHSTSLLKKPGNLPGRGSSVKVAHRDSTISHRGSPTITTKPTSKDSKQDQSQDIGPGLPIPGRPPKHRNSDLTPVDPADSPGNLSRSDPKRKSVSWGDAAEVSIIQQLSQRYMELLWQYLSVHMAQFLVEPAWRLAGSRAGEAGLVDDRLGSLHLCPDTALMMVVCMLQQTCVKAFSNALASQVTDKCAPTPLADGDFSTRTGLQLRNAYHPLLVVLSSLDLPQADKGQNSDKDANSWAAGRNKTCALLLPTLHRLQVTSDLASLWCQVKAAQYLASKVLGPFLLITQSDLKLVSDESRRCLELCQHACTIRPETKKKKPSSTTSPVTALAESMVQSKLCASWQALNHTSAQMQMISGSSLRQFQEQCSVDAKEFFQDELRPGKEWRRKSSQELPQEASAYVQPAIASLLEPVVQGVTQLRTTAQLGAVSIAVTAMCDAWTEHILTLRIRFSLHGAHQLELDFQTVRSWLEQNLQDENVKHSILALDAFKYLSGITALLKRQPRAHSQGPHTRRYDARPICCEVSVSSSTDPYTASSELAPNHSNSNDKSVANGVSGISTGGEDEEEDTTLRSYKVPKMEQWLALRVHGGARNWPKFPSCFNNPNS